MGSDVLLKATADCYVGLIDPSTAEWTAWHDAMLAERARLRKGLDLSRYDDDDDNDDNDDNHEATRWINRTFRQLFLFMYDTSFFDRDRGGGAGGRGQYRTKECIDRWTTMFGKIDSVLLWHAYPRLGFDTRTQFDFYRDMPGGLDGLKRDVSDVFHAHGIRVFVDYNPWAEGSYEELGEIVAALDADGVMLDTMTDAPERLFRAVEARKPNVVFAPELRPRDADLSILRQSWAQWSEVPADGPSILRHRWLVPKHRQLSIRRWDTSRREEIGYSFFNGSGLILWDNIFGSWNPYSRADRRLIAETAVLLDAYADVLVDGEWRPLVPTGDRDLDANEWTHADGRKVVTLRNRSKGRSIACDASGFWGATIAPGGVNAIVTGDPSIARVRERFAAASKAADVALEAYDERTPPPKRLLPAIRPLPSSASRKKQPGLVAIPGTKSFKMRVSHSRRECGCYELGETTPPTNVRWGWFYKDEVTHEKEVALPPFYMRREAVTNREMLEFVRESKYEPTDSHDFLKHLPDADPDDSVTWVSLDDARAFASFYGERLPTEEEWQWAAEQQPALVTGMSGGCWELTESEHDDGHTRFVMLRGGIFLPEDTSEWVIPRHAHPPSFHAKYILLADSLDRSDTVSFRTVRDW